MLPLSDAMYNTVMDLAVQIQHGLPGMMSEPATRLEDMADKLFALREISKRLKELKTIVDAEDKKLVGVLTLVCLASSHGDFKVRTQYVTAEPDVEMATRVPTKKEPVYEEFLKFLGIPDEVIAHGVVSVDFMGWKSLYTAMQSRGQELPPTLKEACKEYTETIVKTRKQQAMKGVNVHGE